MAFHLPSVLKALLFSSGQPLSIKDVQDVFARYHEQHKAPADDEKAKEGAEKTPVADEGEELAPTPGADEVPELVTAAEIRSAMEQVSKDLENDRDVYLLDEGAKGYRIVTNPQFAPWVRALRNEPRPARLTAASLETLAVVAYRQPVTRSEIEAVRGVSADAGLNKLLERELIYITGRAELPGRPLQYGTTDQFLEFVGVKSLVELPASDVLTPRQIDEWLKDAMNPQTPGDEEMGLPLEAGEGETPMEDEAHIEVSESGASQEDSARAESDAEPPEATETDDPTLEPGAEGDVVAETDLESEVEEENSPADDVADNELESNDEAKPKDPQL
ncbi:MAG: SMC-Scp complex subunit ScpB [Synoicihabitans sp.]